MTSLCAMPEYRKGDAFSLTVNLTDDNDQALDLDPSNLAAQVYDSDGNKLTDLLIADGAEVGEYVLTATVDAANWPKEVVTNIFDTSDSTSSAEIHIKVLRQLSREIVPEEL